jgi:chaperonin cofactor prefoldin
MTNGNQPNGNTPQPDRVDTLEGFVEALDISVDILENKTNTIEEEVARHSEKLTELEQKLKDIYGDEDDWDKMCHT